MEEENISIACRWMSLFFLGALVQSAISYDDLRRCRGRAESCFLLVKTVDVSALVEFFDNGHVDELLGIRRPRRRVSLADFFKR
jgi:hypothetical protein